MEPNVCSLEQDLKAATNDKIFSNQKLHNLLAQATTKQQRIDIFMAYCSFHGALSGLDDDIRKKLQG